MPGIRVAIAGYTGLVGEALLNKLIQKKSIQKIFAVGRRPPTIQNEKCIWIESNLENIQIPEAINIGFCALGTTIKKAGSKEAFRKVDCDYVINLAKACYRAQAQNFVLTSAMGADPKSRFLYNRVKGEAEDAVTEIAFEKLIVLRPSLLLGHRNEVRPAEKVATLAFKILGFLFVGRLKKFRPIESQRVAEVALEASLFLGNGRHVLQSDEIHSFALE